MRGKAQFQPGFTYKDFRISSLGRPGKDYWVADDPDSSLNDSHYCSTKSDLASYIASQLVTKLDEE